MDRALGWPLGLLVLLLLLVAAPGASAAEFGIVPGGFAVRMLDAEGNPESRAGSHPDRLQIDFALTVEGTGTTARDLDFDFPPGFGGNPGVVPECPRLTFEEGEECPSETQVGVARFKSSGGSEAELPIFRLEPEPGQPFAFGTKPGLGVPIAMTLRPEDLGITLEASNPQQAPLSEGRIELWGVPADHQQGTTIPRLAFLTTPPRCGPLSFTFRTRSWQEGAPWLSASADTETPLDGCEDLDFEPSLGLQLDNPVADSPTGLRVDLGMPEEGETSELASAPIEEATVAFPLGVTVSPGGAAGLTACSDAEFGLGSAAAVACPASSKVGSIEISTPVVPEPLSGAVYMGRERPGERFRLLIAAPGPGLVLKFLGILRPDPATGRLSATLKGLPELSMRRFSLSIDGGPRSLLASPLECGPATALARFEPYGGGAAVDATASVQIGGRPAGSPCLGPAPFSPQFVARSSRPKAGSLSDFSTTIRRHDGEQLPRRFSVVLPPGVSASLGAVEACPDAGVAVGACPEGSRVGGATAEVGSGPFPATLPGDVYVTGPYHRAPFGLLVRFQAAIGPFDLGVMTLRAGATVDERTGRVSVSIDGIPDLVEGVPIRFQSIELSLDRPGLIRNPTSCAPGSADATIESQHGALATASSELGLSGCHRLELKPRVRMAFAGGAAAGRGSPRLRVSVLLRRGDTNLRALRLSFPPAFKLDSGAVDEICSRLDASEGLCPDSARVGVASARTPILSKPLKGSIFVVQPTGDGSPDLGISLAAKGLHLNLGGRTSSRHGRLVTRLDELPDMPLSAFTMELGGKGGILSLDAPLCDHGRPRRFDSRIAVKGQNGARRTLRSPIGTGADCGGSKAR